MRELTFRPLALNDIDEIYEYTARIWGIDQAEAYLRHLNEKLGNLAWYPLLGRPLDGRQDGILFSPAGNHIVYYRLPDDQTLMVVRILHERMDSRQHL